MNRTHYPGHLIHTHSHPQLPRPLHIPILRLDIIRHSLRLALIVVHTVGIGMNIVIAVVAAVRVVRLLRAHVLHLVDGAALGAALVRPVAADGQPPDVVRVSRAAGAADVLFVAEGFHHDGVGHGACEERGVLRGVSCVCWGWGLRVGKLTDAAGVQRPHVEDVDALHFTEDFEAFETRGLLEVCGDGTGFTALGQKVVFVGDFCGAVYG